MIGLASFGQDATPSDKAPKSTKTLPEWRGHRTGMALSLNAQGLEMKFQIDLMVGPKEGTDQLTWTLVYDGDPGKSERPYLLATINAARGRFAIDQQNSIVLVATLIGNALSTRFFCGFFRLEGRL